MRKSILAGCLFLSLLLLAGCSGKEDAPGTFHASKAELAEAAKLPNTYSYKDISFRYPIIWKTGHPLPGIKFVLIMDSARADFKTNFYFITQPSDPNFARTTAQETQKGMEEMLRGRVNNLKFTKVEKGQWNGINAIYMEYSGTMFDQALYWSQYYYDNGKDGYVLSFTTTAREWPQLEKEARRIFSSVTFKT